MTTRITGFGCHRGQSRASVRSPAWRSGARRRRRSPKSGHGKRFEVADHRDRARAPATTSAATASSAAVPPRVPPRRSVPATSGAVPSAPAAAPTPPPTASGQRLDDEAERDDDRRLRRREPSGHRRSAPVDGDTERGADAGEQADQVRRHASARSCPTRGGAMTASVNAAARAPSTTRWSKVTLMLPTGRIDDLAVAHDGAL